MAKKGSDLAMRWMSCRVTHTTRTDVSPTTRRYSVRFPSRSPDLHHWSLILLLAVTCTDLRRQSAAARESRVGESTGHGRHGRDSKTPRLRAQHANHGRFAFNQCKKIPGFKAGIPVFYG